MHIKAKLPKRDWTSVGHSDIIHRSLRAVARSCVCRPFTLAHHYRK